MPEELLDYPKQFRQKVGRFAGCPTIIYGIKLKKLSTEKQNGRPSVFVCPQQQKELEIISLRRVKKTKIQDIRFKLLCPLKKRITKSDQTVPLHFSSS